MLMTLGRGLNSAARKKNYLPGFFKLTSKLPSEITFARNSAAATLDKNGKLIQVAIDEPRFGHDEDGTPLGLVIEPSATNRCTNNNVNPVNTTGFSISGTGTLSVVDDSAALAAAGLDLICTSGMVFKAQATTGSAFTVSIPGTVANTSAKSISLYARGEGIGNQTADIHLGGTTLGIAPAGGSYVRYKHQNLTPDSGSREFTIVVEGNETLYFILNQLEDGAYCSSVIPVSGASVTRPADRATLTNINTYNWFSGAQGFMICRYRHERVLTSDSYIAVLNDGGSSHTIGIRMHTSNNSIRGYVRSAGANILTTANNDTQVNGILNAAGLRWNASEAELISAGLYTNATMTLPSGINQLELGARNGGTSPMNGYIESIYISKDNVTSEQLGKLLQKSGDMVVAGGGQSLIRGHFVSQESSGEDGKLKHRDIIGNIKRGSTITLIDGSTGGSAASKTSNDTNYWWDLATSSRGPAFDSFYAEIADSHARPTHILWAQGEDDSHQIGTNTSTTQYKQAVEAIFADMRITFGDIPVYIQMIGRRSSFANTGGIQAVRNIQKELIVENSWCFEASEIYDQTLYDGVHVVDAGYEVIAERNALALTNSVGATGPMLKSASLSGSIITVTLAHDTGTDFTPSSGISGFRFFDDSAEINIASAVRTDANIVTLTLDSTPVESTKTLYYGYDDMANITIGNILKDNALIPMPLRTASISVN